MTAANIHGQLSISVRWNTSSPEGGLPIYDVSLGAEKPVPVSFPFRGLIPDSPTATASESSADTMLRVVASRLSILRRDVHWLTCVRDAPQRFFSPRSTRRIEIEPTGADAPALLAEDRHLERFVSAWFETATSHRFQVVQTAERFRLVLSPLDNPKIQVDLVDTGEGMGQVLPVLVLAARANEGSLGKSPIIAIEHPELHLHPRAERELAQAFCHLAARRSSCSLLETHSQNFLLQVQLAILSGHLMPDDVVVYWIRELSDGSSVAERICFDELARPIGNRWPPEVFNEESEQARQIVLARRAKS